MVAGKQRGAIFSSGRGNGWGYSSPTARLKTFALNQTIAVLQLVPWRRKTVSACNKLTAVEQPSSFCPLGGDSLLVHALHQAGGGEGSHNFAWSESLRQ